jgi:carbon-monoxide dehydrogenase small subunit
MKNIVNCKVNGINQSIAVDHRDCLADTLRQELNLTSVKKGCEVGECGACTVLIDGEAINTCTYLSIWAEGKEITTLEGLQDIKGNLHPVQQAFIDKAAIQCGFCSPGIIMSSVEIAGRGIRYTREEIRKEISGHICRCTGYENIIDAIEQAIDILDNLEN